MSRSARALLATGGTQEIAEGLARRPEGESKIAEMGHHRWRYAESPEGEKLQENLIQNYTKYYWAITDGR